MNEECKYCSYLKQCPDIVEHNSVYCKCHKRISKDRNISYERLQNNWNELKNNLKEKIDICDGCIDTMQSDLQEIAPRGYGKSYLTSEIFKNKIAKISFEFILNKMQELEGNNER